MPKREPFADLEQFLKQVTGDVGHAVGTDAAVDLVDEGDAFVLVVDLPGVEAADVDLTVEERTVTVRAEREQDDGTDYVRRERRRHDVDRRVTLPAAVEETDASATLDDGVLTVSLPKRGGDEGTKIDVE